jgi:hypothetical protein
MDGFVSKTRYERAAILAKKGSAAAAASAVPTYFGSGTRGKNADIRGKGKAALRPKKLERH